MSQSNEIIEFTTKLSYETYMKFIKFTHFHGKTVLYYVLNAAIAGLALLSTFSGGFDGLSYLTLAVAVFSMLLMLYRSYSAFILPKRVYNSEDFRNTYWSYLFAPEYMDVITKSENHSSSTHFLYEAVYKAYMTDELIVIYMNMKSAYIINKAEIDAQSIFAVGERLKSKVKKYTDYNKAPASRTPI